jgi:ferric-dicitrate binding protein FerR (iron transport regulator)
MLSFPLLALAAALSAQDLAPSAVLADVKGGVLLNNSTAGVGQPVSAGAELRLTGKNPATVLFSGGTKIRLGKDARLKIETMDAERTTVMVSGGKAEFWVRSEPGRLFVAKSPTATAHIKGTVFSIEVQGPDKSTLSLFEGSVKLTDNFGETRSVQPGFSVASDLKNGLATPARLAENYVVPSEPKVATAAPASRSVPKEKKRAEQDAPAQPDPEVGGQKTTQPLTLPQSTVVSPSSP